MKSTYSVRISTYGPNNQYRSYRLGLPLEIGKVIPEDQEFVPELTEDGILYRPVNHIVRVVPSWAKNENDVSD